MIKATSLSSIIILTELTGIAHNLIPSTSRVFEIFIVTGALYSRSQVRDEAEAMLKRFGLMDRAKTYPAQLSGRQQQRAAIARAMVMKPRVPLRRAYVRPLPRACQGGVESHARDRR